ncbi:hypothetical protein [Rhizobium grahamii]|uniref:Uncharacterized protein n=1 Tax=Rhizobium grahamii CCGE 502 TaxID=990285 RepID=S3HK62_9HYPH|nr:hypothetical protein [Rhizobium grahamii]EPE98450.1 hypothetical protein RGCCGE502_08485 [Rhizobium grahamii CCGE 502]
MTKLNIYRACLLLLLAGVAYAWPIVGIIILAWWGGALIGLLVKGKTPPQWQVRPTFQDTQGCLSMWLYVWNGFYVWKDLDNDYWKKDAK